MCIVSAVLDHYGQWPPKKYPDPYKKEWEQFDFPESEPKKMDEKDLQKFIDILKKSQEYDKKNDEPHCADPNKAIPLNDAIENAAARLSQAINDGDVDLADRLTAILERLYILKQEIVGV